MRKPVLPYTNNKCADSIIGEQVFLYKFKKQEGTCFLPYCLLANVIGKFQRNPEQPYVRLASK